MPEISVIISTYDRRKELKRAIRSVLDQSFKDFELIVVDDSSPFSVKNICDSFGDPRVRFFRTEANFGHDGRPKNIGLMNAAGKYVCFLDDDDAYRKDALKILHTYIEESGADVVYGDYLFHDGRKTSPGWSVEFDLKRLLKHNFISMVTAMARLDAVKGVGGFDEKVPKFKDWNLWLRMHKAGASFYHVPIIVADVHQMGTSVSTRFLAESGEDGANKPTYFDPVDCPIWPDETLLGKRQPLKVAVYTLTNGRLAYLKQMAERMDRLAGFPFDWFVLDDASQDGTADWLRTVKGGKSRGKVTVKRHDEPRGLAKSWNAAVDLCGRDYDILIKADDDAMFISEGWLSAMAGIYERNRRFCLSPCVEGLEGLPGGTLRHRNIGSPYMMVNDTVLGLVPHIGGIVYATCSRLWDGYRIPEEGQGNRDVLLSVHARRSGYTLAYLEETRLSHGPNGTLGQKADYPDRK